MFYIACHKSGNTEISFKPTSFDTSELWDLHHAQLPLHYTYSNQALVLLIIPIRYRTLESIYIYNNLPLKHKTLPISFTRKYISINTIR